MTDAQQIALVVLIALVGTVGIALILGWGKYGPAVRAYVAEDKRRVEFAWWEHQIDVLMKQHRDHLLGAARCEMELSEMIGQMPAEAVEPVLKAVKYGHAFQMAAIRKAEELGLHTPRIDVHAVELTPEIEVAIANTDTHEPRTVFKDGRLVTR
jgi:hypothetical protein